MWRNGQSHEENVTKTRWRAGDFPNQEVQLKKILVLTLALVALASFVPVVPAAEKGFLGTGVHAYIKPVIWETWNQTKNDSLLYGAGVWYPVSEKISGSMEAMKPYKGKGLKWVVSARVNLF